MLERVLVPLDGSALAESILPAFYPILRCARSEVLLVHASPEAGEKAREGSPESQKASDYLQTVVTNLPALHIAAQPCIRQGPAVRAILNVGTEEEASLIARAGHGEASPDELTLGPVTQRLFLETPQPVVAMHPIVSPPGEAPTTISYLSYDSILVPLDGTPASKAALPLAWEIAHLMGSRLELLRVVERVGEAERHIPPEDMPAEGPAFEPVSLDERQAQRELEDLALRTSRSGVPSIAIIEKGQPAEAILSVARAHGTGLIVMATRARPEISRYLLGSVAPRIMREAKIPVLAIGSREAAGPAKNQ